jgi:hypothetical protein
MSAPQPDPTHGTRTMPPPPPACEGSWASGTNLPVGRAMVGLIALVQNDFYVATRDYPSKFDATTWGWIHLLGGVLLALAGWALLSGQTWARVVGIVLAVLSAIANFLSPLLPAVGDADHRPGRLRDLGAGRPRPGARRSWMMVGIGRS